MKTYFRLIPVLAAALSGCATIGPGGTADAPRVDYHQHLVSAAFEPVVKMPRRDGAALVRELDAASIQRAVVLSVGYSFADERKKFANPDELTRQENDWTSAQVTANARRLIGFCSANPLRDAALAELDRCLRLHGMVGIKVHMGNAGLTLRNPAHVARMQQLFALAGKRRAPVLIHMRARGGENYGAEDARLLLDRLVPAAPGIEIVIAHLGASGPGYSSQHEEIMGVLGESAQRRDPRMRNLYVDLSGVVAEDTSAADGALIAHRIRQLGLDRALYGSDLSVPGGSIRSGWEIFRSKVPLTSREIRQIAGNRTRFSR